MIALAIVGWEALAWGLFYVTWNNGDGNSTWAFIFGAAAFIGPVAFVPMMSKVRPSKETYGDRMRRDAALEEKKRKR